MEKSSYTASRQKDAEYILPLIRFLENAGFLNSVNITLLCQINFTMECYKMSYFKEIPQYKNFIDVPIREVKPTHFTF